MFLKDQKVFLPDLKALEQVLNQYVTDPDIKNRGPIFLCNKFKSPKQGYEWQQMIHSAYDKAKEISQDNPLFTPYRIGGAWWDICKLPITDKELLLCYQNKRDVIRYIISELEKL